MRHALLFLFFSVSSAAAEPRLDPYGDPLPEGASARIGSIRTHIDALSWAALTPDGKRIISGGMYGEQRLSIWDSATMKRLRTLPTNEKNETWAIAISPDGKRAAAVLSSPGKSEYAMSAVVWEIDSGKRLCDVPLGKRNSGAERLVFSADGKRFAVVCEDLRIIEFETGKIIAKTPFNVRLGRLSFVGQARFVFGGRLPKLHLWDAHTGNAVTWVGAVPDFAIDDQAMTPDGKYLVVASGCKLSRYKVELPSKLGEPAKLTSRQSIEVRDRPKTDCWISSDGRQCVVCSNDGGVELCDFARLKVTGAMELKDHELFDVAFLANGPLLLIRGGTNRWIRNLEIVDLITGKNITRDRGLHSVHGDALWLPDGKRIQTGLQLWQVETGKYVGETTSVDMPMASSWKPPTDGHFEISADGRTALVAIGNGSRNPILLSSSVVIPEITTAIEVWDVAANRRLRKFRGRDGDLPPLYGAGHSPALTPDGRLFIRHNPQSPPRLEIWNTTVGRLIAALDAKSTIGEIQSWCIMPDGRRIFIAGTMAVGVFDLRSQRLETQINHRFEKKDVRYSTVSPDGRLAAAARFAGELFVFDLIRNELVQQRMTQQNELRRVAFSPDGRQLLSQGREGWVHVWQIPELKALPDGWKGEDFEAAWKSLLAPNAADAMVRWKQCGGPAVEFIGKRIEAAKGQDQKELAELIAQLGALEFRRREAAQRELSKRGEIIVPVLQRRLEKERDLEIRNRLEKIIDNPKEASLPVPSPELVRSLRASEILEAIGTPAAKSHLKRLAQGANGDPLTEEAQAALRRWK